MPAEWEPHEATWIAWPHNKDDWPGKFAAIPFVYGEIVRQLHQSEEVRILVDNANVEQRSRTLLSNLKLNSKRVSFWPIRTNRSWTRDYGPMFVQSPAEKKVVIHQWRFTGWAKYPNHRYDSRVAHQVFLRLERQKHVTCHSLVDAVLYQRPGQRPHRVVLEGGAIDVNGHGSLLTTEECLLSKVQRRNPGFTRHDYETVFADYLGVQNVLWLGKGIAGDDTHGHVDDLARFVGPRTVVAVVEDNAKDENYQPLQENLDRLKGMTDQDGKKLDIVKLPMPAPVYWSGQRLPASYANFYIANDRLLVPTFNDPNDRKALGILADLFLDHTVIGIHAVDLVWGLGTLHCLTQQQPAVQS
jgi:agmatine deiminase